MNLLKKLALGLVGIWTFGTFSNSASAKMAERLRAINDGLNKADEKTQKDLGAYYPKKKDDEATKLAWGWFNWGNWGNWGNWNNWSKWDNWSDFSNWQKFSNY